MKNLKIGLLLHFYQPWWQAPEILKRIVNECYRPILELVKKAPGFCFSANVNYSLLELLDHDYEREFKEAFGLSIPDYDFRDVIDGFRAAVREEKIELLGSTAYHPIMPLLPRNLQMSQMICDTELKKAYWGIERNCGGIFLPEMAFSQYILANLQACRYEWTVLDDELFRYQYGDIPCDYVVSLRGSKIFFRSNYWSNRIAFGRFGFKEIQEKMDCEIPRWTKEKPAYLILAMDAETFGHHHPALINDFLEPMLKKWGSGNQNILTPLERIGEDFPSQGFVKIFDGSWSTSESDYHLDNPFPLWNSPSNPHHQNLWKLVNIAVKYAGKRDVGLDCLKITSSCHWWWISGRPSWQPMFMRIAADKAMEIIKICGPKWEIEEAKQIFDKLMAVK